MVQEAREALAAPKAYLASMWNWFDVVNLTLYIVTIACWLAFMQSDRDVLGPERGLWICSRIKRFVHLLVDVLAVRNAASKTLLSIFSIKWTTMKSSI